MRIAYRILDAIIAAQYLYWIIMGIGSWIGWCPWPNPAQGWIILGFGYGFVAAVERAFPFLKEPKP